MMKCNKHTTMICTTMALALSACGGGSDSGNTVADINPATATFPAYSLTVGDYAVYNRTTTNTAAQSSVMAHLLTAVNSDGTWARQTAYSSGSSTSTTTYTADTKTIKTTSATTICTTSPALPAAPSPGARSGSKMTAQALQTCQPIQAGPNIISDTSTDMSVIGVENITVAAGTFDAFLWTFTTSSKNSNVSSATNGKCWTDIRTGQTVKCENSSISTPTATGATPSSSTSTMELAGYSIGGKTVGAIEKRFAGLWTATFNWPSGSSSTCSHLTISDTGAISGSCTIAANFVMSGTVDINGKTSATSSTGYVLSGTLDTPMSGKGTWKNGANSGTWTAVRE